VAVRLRELAPGKVNLSLFLGPVRAQDARHRLVTLYESVSLADELTLETLARGSDEVLCPGVSGRNLVSEALEGLRTLGWSAPAVRITVDKRIPVAAGMGGGSADAAAALRLARALGERRAQWRVPERWLAELAPALGADVPAALAPGVSIGTGAGELVAPRAALAGHALVIVPLPYALSTPAVYREADRLGLPRCDAELDALELAMRSALGVHQLPGKLLVNDLEPAARSLCPPIGEALAALRACGAAHVLVSGSGPTCFGIWWGAGAGERARRASAALRKHWPAARALEPVGPRIGNPADASGGDAETLPPAVG
jgi:4-diphosphocytidyl-2-C-methyl-D-erythritol kinase